MEETDIKIKDQCKYLYRAVDSTRARPLTSCDSLTDATAALRFFRKASGHHGEPGDQSVKGERSCASFRK
ncbi:DDE-type integrase/transposase/recombinase [Rouxiella badensis]|nr:DDE-type integrase/transposase/recombinase [Rouxiella badensis]